MKHGRRLCLIVSSMMGIISVSLPLYLNIWTVLIGRVFLGISVGLYSTIVPRFIEETAPFHLYD
jgi:MFS family permease